mmetsp:Transcript_72196/g.191888  ORF Transcript_72196/g.191888 Transcript_72196/m.191888 type:complete len:258 (+) Transcript_72196:381-1154(+)
MIRENSSSVRTPEWSSSNQSKSRSASSCVIISPSIGSARLNSVRWRTPSLLMSYSRNRSTTLDAFALNASPILSRNCFSDRQTISLPRTSVVRRDLSTQRSEPRSWANLIVPSPIGSSISKKALMSSTSPVMLSERESLRNAARLTMPCSQYLSCQSVKSCGLFSYRCANSFSTPSCCTVGLFILRPTACFMRAASRCALRSSSKARCATRCSSLFLNAGMLPLDRFRIDCSCCKLSSPSPLASQVSKMASAAEFST